MPIYAYRCESCGHAQDVLQKISDPLLTVCPVCGAEHFKKQVTAAGFQLKGSGWYVTDFRGSGAGRQASDASSSESSAVEASCPDPPSAEAACGDCSPSSGPASSTLASSDS